MFNLPKTTEIRKIITKKVIYSKFKTELSGEKKKQFDGDISKITIINELSPVSINIKEGEKVSSIFVLQVDLKHKKYNEKNLVLISKLFGQKIVLVLQCNDEIQLAIYQTKMLYSKWMKTEECFIDIKGLTLDSVWENIVSQVSGIELDEEKTIDEQIVIEEEREKLIKLIEDLEKKARKEVQSKKKFELFQQIKKYQKKLEDY